MPHRFALNTARRAARAFLSGHAPVRTLLAGAIRVLPALAVGALATWAHAPAQAATSSSTAATSATATATPIATASFTLSGVRPEALSWLWDNLDEGLFKRASAKHLAFRWLNAPATPEHLGYSAAARYEATATWSGANHRIELTQLDPSTVRTRVASDNFLGSKPYSFLAASVSVDHGSPFTVLVQYRATGSGFGDTSVQIEASPSAQNGQSAAWVKHFTELLQGLQPTVMTELDQRYFNAVLKTRGFYRVGQVDSKWMVPLNVVQEIKGIDSDMLRWWWDHIGNTERYRLWQPIDHVTFEWTVEPTTPDMQYDVGATQKVKEYVGKSAWTLLITGADPKVKTPPAPLGTDPYFFATANPPILNGLLPDNTLLHSWKPNATGDGVVLTTTFLNTALVRVLNPRFFEDLGSHALREFQMLPYFLPRLYRREQLGE